MLLSSSCKGGLRVDHIDRSILHILAQDANATSSCIAEQVKLSVPAVNKRIAKMKKEGLIRSFTILTDKKQVQKPIIAFIFLVARYENGVQALLDYMAQDEDVLECHGITGEYDYLIKVCAESIEALENKLLRLKKHKCVVKSHTMFSLMEHKFNPTILPGPEKGE